MTSIVTSEAFDNEDAASLRLRILNLESKDAELLENIQKLQAFIDTGKADLNQRCTSIIDDLVRVYNQIEYIQRELDARNRPKPTGPELTPDLESYLKDDEPSDTFEEPESDSDKVEALNAKEDESTSSVLALRKRCKKLYQRIANKTHPDKTPDKSMHKIFIDAKVAYRANDEEQLEYLWKCVVEQVESDSIEHLRSRKLRIENSIRGKMRIIHSIMNDEEVKIIQMFRNPMTNIQDHAVYLYRHKLVRNLEKAKIDLNSLIHKSGIYPK